MAKSATSRTDGLPAGEPVGTIYLLIFPAGKVEYEFVSAESYHQLERELAEAKKLKQFGIVVLEEHRQNECCDLDGGFLQDMAEKYGLLERVSVTEPCGENCACQEWDDFPQECLRYPAAIKAMIDAAIAQETPHG